MPSRSTSTGNVNSASNLSCAIVLNAAGDSVVHFVRATRLAAQLRYLATAPTACATLRLAVFVDERAYGVLMAPPLRDLAISGRVWDTIDTYPALPPVRPAPMRSA